MFQSGIGGSVSRGTFCGLGRSLSRLAVVAGRVELAPRGRRGPDQLGLVHLHAFQLTGRGIDAEGGRGHGPRGPAGAGGGPRTRPRRLAAGPPRRRRGCRGRLQGQLARPLPLALDLDDDLAAVGAMPGLGNRTRIWIGWFRCSGGGRSDLGLLWPSSFERARNRIVWIQYRPK